MNRSSNNVSTIAQAKCGHRASITERTARGYQSPGSGRIRIIPMTEFEKKRIAKAKASKEVAKQEKVAEDEAIMQFERPMTAIERKRLGLEPPPAPKPAVDQLMEEMKAKEVAEEEAKAKVAAEEEAMVKKAAEDRAAEESRVKAEAEAREKQLADEIQAKNEADNRAAEEARIKEEAEAREKQLAEEVKAKKEAEAKAAAEAEAKMKAEQEAKTKAGAEAKAEQEAKANSVAVQ